MTFFNYYSTPQDYFIVWTNAFLLGAVVIILAFQGRMK